MTRAVVLFGHGSRDPGWRAPMDAVAGRIRQRDPQVAVACAFLELQQPDLPSAVDGLVAAGATRITVLPMFLGVGKHAREDLPVLVNGIRRRHPTVALEVAQPVGESPDLLDLVATMALQRL
ncbi:MAG: sirohydrochlorin chelatase [Ramlibacter sp.]